MAPLSRICRLSLPALLAVCAAAGAGCDKERRTECDELLEAMRPLREGKPSSAVVDRVRSAVSAISFQDEPLGVYAKNYVATLSVLGSTLGLEESASSPDAIPDGTHDVVAKNLKEARTDDADVTRYCSP